MNGIEEVQKSIKEFICEKKQIQQQIVEIEQKRTQLALERNEKKQVGVECKQQVEELGKQITELGNQSQELQNKLDFKTNAVKGQINASIDNFISEGIRKIRKINEQIQELEGRIQEQKEKHAKYQLQKQEFYVRFGRMPELSENAKQECETQEQEYENNGIKIQEFNALIEELKEEITQLAKIRREIKNGNWNFSIEKKVEIEEVSVEEFGPIQEVYIEEFEPIEELQVEEFYVEEFKPIQEINIEEFEEIGQARVETIQTVDEQETIDEMEELARLIVEQISEEQTKDFSNKTVENITENNQNDEDIITFEKEEGNEEKIIIPLFGQKATIANITIKFEENELVYKAHMSDGHQIKISPAKIGTENVLLRDKKNREECKEILTSYSKSEYKIFDKNVINKIDPLVCELLIECAQKYKYDAQELMYNYAMSFSETTDFNSEQVPAITYNTLFIGESKLSRREKAIINKICKNAKGNSRVEIIEAFSGFRKIKYILKKIFSVNNIKVLPEAKY